MSGNLNAVADCLPIKVVLLRGRGRHTGLPLPFPPTKLPELKRCRCCETAYWLPVELGKTTGTNIDEGLDPLRCDGMLF